MLNEWLHLKYWAEYYDLAFLNEPWFIKVVLISLATVIAHFVGAFILRRIVRLSARTQGYWDDVLAHAALKPVPVAIWLIGVSVALIVFGKAKHLKEELEIITMVREVGLSLCVAWFFWRLVNDFKAKYIEDGFEKGEDVDRTSVDAIAKIAHLVILLITLVVVMQALGFSVTGLLAAGGMSGIIIGYAAKDLLANVFGGLTIYLDRPFSVGDHIRSPDKDIEGVVELINWRHTRIRRQNKNPIYVPNALFTTIAVENPSRMTHRRIRQVVGLRYADIDKMAPIVTDIRAMLKAHPAIDKTQAMVVHFDAYNASSIDMLLQVYTETTVLDAFQDIKQEVLLKIAEIVSQHGAEFAFPTQTVHLASGELQA